MPAPKRPRQAAEPLEAPGSLANAWCDVVTRAPSATPAALTSRPRDPLHTHTRGEPRRDIRSGGAWTPIQRVKNDVIWAVAMLALAASRRVPLRVLRTLGRGLGSAAHAFASKARRTAMANVARVFPDVDETARRALVRRSFVTMGELLADTVALLRPHGGPLLELSAEARRVLDEALAEGRGVVFASAHLGPWERVAASLVAAGIPFATLARESYDPRFAHLYEALRTAHGVQVVWRASPGAATGIVRTLRSGRVLGIPMDLRSRVASCDAPFLGHAAPTPVGPARIALRTGAAVVVGTVAPRDAAGALIITATRIPTTDLDRADLSVRRGNSEAAERRLRAAAGAQELTERINQEISRRILALPQSWVWMHERWTTEDGVC
jgi:KDO2-lipid IV(A) lauroyltransferase